MRERSKGNPHEPENGGESPGTAAPGKLFVAKPAEEIQAVEESGPGDKRTALTPEEAERQAEDRELDEELDETFPASDPLSIIQPNLPNDQ